MAFNHGVLSEQKPRGFWPFLSHISRLSEISLAFTYARGKVTFDRAAGETGKVQFCDSASANAAGRPGARWAFTLSHDLKEIHPLWIMFRFSVWWRASRIQYLRPLSSYSLLGARVAHGNGLIVIVIEARGLSGCPLHPHPHPRSTSYSTHRGTVSTAGSAGCRAYNISDSHSARTYPHTCTPRHDARTRVTTCPRLSAV